MSQNCDPGGSGRSGKHASMKLVSVQNDLQLKKTETARLDPAGQGALRKTHHAL